MAGKMTPSFRGARRAPGIHNHNGDMDSGLAPRARPGMTSGLIYLRQNQQQGNAMIEFFFDCSSPWTYLAFHNIQPLAKEFGAEISWRPILVGGIFNTINPSVYATREHAGAAESALTRRRTWRTGRARRDWRSRCRRRCFR